MNKQQENKVIEDAPFDWLNIEPEERKYWRINSQENFLEYKPHIRAFIAASSELAAHRAATAKANPYEVTRRELSAIAKQYDWNLVVILDETGQIVEEWTI